MSIIEVYGTTKITNPDTLLKWIDSGKYQKLIDQGFKFNTGCGRFRKEVCKCCKCKNNIKPIK